MNKKSRKQKTKRASFICCRFLFFFLWHFRSNKTKIAKIKSKNNTQRTNERDECSFFLPKKKTEHEENEHYPHLKRMKNIVNFATNSGAHIKYTFRRLCENCQFIFYCSLFVLVRIFCFFIWCAQHRTQESWKITLFNLLLWLFCLCF